LCQKRCRKQQQQNKNDFSHTASLFTICKYNYNRSFIL
jgi:hypothetical protein